MYSENRQSLYVKVSKMLLLICLIIILIYCFNTTFYVKRGHHEDPYNLPQNEQYRPYYNEMVHLVDALNNEPYEAVSVKSFDGLTLRGRLYIYDETAPIELTFNGYRTNGIHDCGGVFQISRHFGHNMLVVDQRATGESDGNVISFGINERYDVVAWAQFIADRYPQMKIVLVGCSLGAATVLMASELKMPTNVVGIVADSAYTSPKAIIKKVIKEMKMSPTIMYPFVKLSAKLLGHFNLDASSAIQAVQKTKLPILIIHGESDRYVPCYMAHQNFTACKSSIKMLLTVPKAPHDISLLVDWDKYQGTVEKFFKRIGIPMKNE